MWARGFVTYFDIYTKRKPNLALHMIPQSTITSIYYFNYFIRASVVKWPATINASHQGLGTLSKGGGGACGRPRSQAVLRRAAVSGMGIAARLWPDWNFFHWGYNILSFKYLLNKTKNVNEQHNFIETALKRARHERSYQLGAGSYKLHPGDELEQHSRRQSTRNPTDMSIASGISATVAPRK